MVWYKQFHSFTLHSKGNVRAESSVSFSFSFRTRTRARIRVRVRVSFAHPASTTNRVSLRLKILVNLIHSLTLRPTSRRLASTAQGRWTRRSG